MKTLYFLLAALVTAPAFGVTGLDFDFELVVGGLNSPTDIANAGDDRLFLVSSPGVIRILDGNGTVLSTPFLNISNKVLDGGERGLLGLAFHPNYATNGYFYVNYTRESDGDTVIARYSVSAGDPNIADAGSEVQLLTVNQPQNNHNAGALAFDPGPEQYLHIPLGDGGNGGAEARNVTDLLGTVVRIDVDAGGGSAPDCVGDGVGTYTVPGDNPFVDGPGGDCDEAWAFGLRNPFRMSFDRDTGDLYLGDVGQNSFEEVDFQAAGESGIDWGWNCKEGFATYSPGSCSAPLAKDPFFAYGRAEGRSVIGGYVYRGTAFPNLDGVYFFHDYYERAVWAAQRDQSDDWEVTKYSNALPGTGFASWGEDSDGELYVISRDFSSTGELYRLVDNAAPNDSPVITEGSATSVALDEDSTPEMFSLTLNATDDGPTGDLDWSIASAASNGNALASGSGASTAVSYMPDADYNGSDSFTVAVTDGFGASDTITVDVSVRPRNDAPNNTQTPVISGEPTTGSTLTADTGTWNDDTDLTPGTLSYGFQWESAPDDQNFSPISGASSSSYELTAQDEGQFLRVTVTATDDGEGLPATQAATASSSSVEAFAPNDPPVITEGSATSVALDEDSAPEAFSLTLNATDDGPTGDLNWSIDSPPPNGSASASGSGSSVAVSYTPNANYNGSDSFVVAVTDGFGAPDTIVIDLTVRPRNDAPNNTQAPSILGVAIVGATLTAESGTWNDSSDLTPGNIDFSFQWQRSADDQNFTDIGGANGLDYDIQAQDEGQFLRFRVTATDDGEGLPASQQVTLSSASAEVFLDDPPPRILEGPAINIFMDEDGDPQSFALNLRASDDGPVDELLWNVSSAATNGNASVPAGGTPIAVTYEPAVDFHGQDSFEVTLTDGSGQTDTIDIGVIISPRNDPPQNDILPTISGTAEVGLTLTVDPGAWSDDADLVPGQLQFGYQWQVSVDGNQYSSIPDANSASYTITIADEGQFIRAMVTATDDGEGLPALQSATAESLPVQVPLDTLLISDFELAP